MTQFCYIIILELLLKNDMNKLKNSDNMNQTPQKTNPWSWIPTLYFAQGLPYVAVMTISLIMYKRLGISNTDIALYTGWLNLPWVIKPFWSPFVDLIKTKRWWILTMQWILAFALAGIAFTIPTPFFFQLTLAVFWIVGFTSATHDIAADGFYMYALTEHEQSLYVGIRSTFYRIATVAGQGLLVIIAGLIEVGTGLNPAVLEIQADPSYTNYVGEIVMNRAGAVPVPVYEKDNFNFTYENLKSRVTDKTKAIILNSPCNPTGGVATRETMETVAKVALEYDLYVIYDAVYKHLIYNDTDYINIAVLDGMRERTIYVDSFSKTYAMTGWRLGYMAGPRNILSRLPKLQENMPSCLPEFVQYAGIEALKNGDEDIAMMNRQYAERRKLVLERINGIKGLSCTPPNGAFYAFVNIKETGMTSVEFCEKLLEKEGVVTAPGSAFGEQGEGYVRLSYATSMEQINRGMDRIQRFMESIM